MKTATYEITDQYGNEFVVKFFRNNRNVTVIVEDVIDESAAKRFYSEFTQFVGKARCNSTDKFDVRTGENIAFMRAIHRMPVDVQAVLIDELYRERYRDFFDQTEEILEEADTLLQKAESALMDKLSVDEVQEAVGAKANEDVSEVDWVQRLVDTLNEKGFETRRVEAYEKTNA